MGTRQKLIDHAAHWSSCRQVERLFDYYKQLDVSVSDITQIQTDLMPEQNAFDLKLTAKKLTVVVEGKLSATQFDAITLKSFDGVFAEYEPGSNKWIFIYDPFLLAAHIDDDYNLPH